MHQCRMRWRVRLRGCAWSLLLACWLCANASLAGSGSGQPADALSGGLSGDVPGDPPGVLPGDRQRVEQGLLSMLGLPRRPHPRLDAGVAPDVPDHMRRLYERARRKRTAHGLHAAGLHAGSANTIRSFIHEESKIDLRFPHHHKFRLWFNVSGVPEDETFRAAELMLQPSLWGAEEAEQAEGGEQRVLLYDLVRPGRRSKGQSPILRLIDSKVVPAGEEVRLDALSAARRWVREPRHNHGLVAHVATRHGDHAERPHVRLRRAVVEDEATWRRARPLLLLYTEDGRAREARGARALVRAERAATPRRAHRRKNGHEACRRRPLFVDFADVGWSDWIVAPNGYDAFYCQGDCSFPLADHLNVTNHAVVQTLVNSVNPAAVPKACCVPTQLSSISMLYLDEENKVVLKNYQDMAVVGCGCR